MGKKIILYIATSLDGFIARKNGSVDWLDKFNESGEDYGYDDFIKSINTVVMGKTTYDQILGFGTYPYKNKKGYVFTSHERKDGNVTFVNGDVKDFINNLDKNEEHIIWLVGGANLVNQFLKENLIDEFIIFVLPIILGDGIRLFKENNKELPLSLKKINSYESGMTEIHYERA